jgi:STE24 endopeptidase
MTRLWPLFNLFKRPLSALPSSLHVRILSLMLCGVIWLCLPRMGQAQSSVPSPRAGTVLHTAPPRSAPYTPHVPRRAVLYQRSAYTLGLFGLVWHGLGIWLLLRTGLSARWRDGVYRSARRSPPRYGKAPPLYAVALFVMTYLVFILVWTLPIGLAGLALEHRFGFSRQTVGGYFVDDLRGLLFNAILVPLIWGAYWLRARSPRRWWLIVWACTLPLLCIQMVVQPVVVAPLYNHFTPLPPGPLRDKLLALASQASITHARVFVADTSRRTTHVNAYVTGIGPTTRIVIEDTALQTLPEDQLLAMMGHEMGHYVEGHIWVSLVVGAAGAGVFLWLLAQLVPRLAYRTRRRYGLHGAWDLAALPLVMLTLFVLLEAQLPVANALSRYLEHRADTFGLRTTGLNDATARLFVGFAERDYADPDPPRVLHLWFGTHPTLSERIDYARHFRK